MAKASLALAEPERYDNSVNTRIPISHRLRRLNATSTPKTTEINAQNQPIKRKLGKPPGRKNETGLYLVRKSE